MILEPVERRARRARGVEARRADDDGLVGDFENALCGGAERHDAIASEGSERVAHEQARGRLADAALAGDERDLAAAGNRSLDPSDELALTEFGRVRWDRDHASREQVDRAAPAGGWWLSSRPEHPLGREVGGAQTRRTRRPWTDATVGLPPVAVRCKGCARRRLGDRHDVVLPRPERLEVAPLRTHRPVRSVDLRKYESRRSEAYPAMRSIHG